MFVTELRKLLAFGDQLVRRDRLKRRSNHRRSIGNSPLRRPQACEAEGRAELEKRCTPLRCGGVCGAKPACPFGNISLQDQQVALEAVEFWLAKRGQLSSGEL